MNTGISIRPARIASIDVVRLVALVAIVWGHTFPSSELADRLVQSWRLPVFFMLTGYFWSAGRTLHAETEKRFRTLLVPYAAWGLIITVSALPKNTGFEPSEIIRMIGGAVLGGDYATRPYTTFWFFTALFIAVVVYRYLLRFPTPVRLTVIAVGAAANIVAGEQLALVPLAVGTAMGALIFLEAGCAVRRLQSLIQPWARAGLAVVAIAVGIAAMTGDFVPLDMKNGQFPAIAMVPAIAFGSAMLLAATAWTRMPARLASAVTTLAKPSLVVIILHPLVLLFLPPETTSVPLVVVVVVAFLVPLALGHVLVRTRLAPVLVGVDRVGRPSLGSHAAPGQGRWGAVVHWLMRPIDRPGPVSR